MLKQSLIANNSVKLHQRAENWQEAIQIAIDMLIQAGVVMPCYYDNIVQSIKNMGPYIIIAPGFAMPHARPEDGVIKTGFSLVTFDSPIYFDGEEEPIQMMIALAGSDSNQHMEGLMEITSVLDDEESETGINIEKFMRCQTKEEIFTVIDNALNKK